MKYRCEICNKTFKTSQALAFHKRNKHRELSKSEVLEVSKFNYWIRELDSRISSVEEGLKILAERIGKYAHVFEESSDVIRIVFSDDKELKNSVQQVVQSGCNNGGTNKKAGNCY